VVDGEQDLLAAAVTHQSLPWPRLVDDLAAEAQVGRQHGVGKV
jgi:hypothetical protein